MPTPDAEIDAAARRVFEARGLWKPGQQCEGRLTPNFRDEHTFECEAYGQLVWSNGHELLPLDWRDWSVFGRLLLWAKTDYQVHFQWAGVTLDPRIGPFYQGCHDDPRAALILAVAAMLGVE